MLIGLIKYYAKKKESDEKLVKFLIFAYVILPGDSIQLLYVFHQVVCCNHNPIWKYFLYEHKINKNKIISVY